MDTGKTDTPDRASNTELRSALGRAHDEAAQLLAGADSAPQDIVAWLSAHIAAFEHAVYPVIKKELSNGAELINEDRAIVSRLARALRIKERHHSGDVLASGLSPERLDRRIAELVDRHRELQDRILDKLEATLGDAVMQDLRRSYSSALEHAPTRPHLHLARGGLMFRLDALRDKILDTMDGRHVPVPRLPRRQILPGRWGNWLIGQQAPEVDGHRTQNTS
jgi:hypothetical protein